MIDSNSIWGAAVIILYFLPFMVAKFRQLKVSDGILILNIVAAWTVVGWIAALIWAVSAQDKRQAVRA